MSLTKPIITKPLGPELIISQTGPEQVVREDQIVNEIERKNIRNRCTPSGQPVLRVESVAVVDAMGSPRPSASLHNPDALIERVNLPNAGLMYASIYDINRITQLLLPVITNEKIINFILRITQQNLRDLLCIEIFSKLLNSEEEFPTDRAIGADRSKGGMKRPCGRGAWEDPPRSFARTDTSSSARSHSSFQGDPQICKNLYLRVLTVVLASPYTNTQMLNNAFDKIDQIFDESDNNHTDLKATAVDIMLNYYPSRGERMLNILRAHNPAGELLPIRRNPAAPIPRIQEFDPWQNDEQDQGENLLDLMRANVPEIGVISQPKMLIYNDRENVHNSALNASIVSACRSIMTMMVTSIIFDEKYKIMVYEEDSIETVKNKLLSVLSSGPQSPVWDPSKQIKIYGDNRQERLQSKMTFEIINSNPEDRVDKQQRLDLKMPRFMIEDKYLYKNVMYHNYFTFPEHITREGKKGRLFEEAFIATNTWLNFVSDEKEEELLMYLFLTDIEDADIIWLRREEIRQELKQLIECPNVDNFIAKIQNHLFPCVRLDPWELPATDRDDESKSKIFKKIRDGTLMEMDLHEILNGVWKFINNKENKSQGTHLQMIERLKEELEDSANICCSGIAARLISSIQGFFDEDKYPSLKIKISIDDEMKSKINTLISQKAIILEIDPVYDINEFKKMVDTVIDENADSIMNEFTPQDIALNGISRENILRVAYDLYNIKHDDE